MPHTVRPPVCAKNPAARPQKVRNDGAVNSGSKQASNASNDGGKVRISNADAPLMTASSATRSP
jgi:hypothetical protein